MEHFSDTGVDQVGDDLDPWLIVGGWADEQDRSGVHATRCKPDAQGGIAITALISSSAMRCARALGRIAISTPQSVLPLFEKVQYTFYAGARRIGMRAIGTTRGARARIAGRSATQQEGYEGLHLLGYAPIEGRARGPPAVCEAA